VGDLPIPSTRSMTESNLWPFMHDELEAGKRLVTTPPPRHPPTSKPRSNLAGRSPVGLWRCLTQEGFSDQASPGGRTLHIRSGSSSHLGRTCRALRGRVRTIAGQKRRPWIDPAIDTRTRDDAQAQGTWPRTNPLHAHLQKTVCSWACVAQ